MAHYPDWVLFHKKNVTYNKKVGGKYTYMAPTLLSAEAIRGHCGIKNNLHWHLIIFK